MKKILCAVFVLLVCCIITGCNLNESIEIGDSIMKIKYDEKIVDLNTLVVVKNGGNYIVLIHNGRDILKKVEFDSNRNVLETKNVQLKESHDLNKYLNEPFEKIVEVLGEEHADIGSGFYKPSYITTDGYLLIFSVEDGSITDVAKLDLLSNKFVDSNF